ncbi:MAG: MarR family winged helix-turn-helix transcriptional regulator [Legionellales bacterium]
MEESMATQKNQATPARMELANRLFFRLYQCANLLHKTGTRAVEDLGLTTQQWAVLGALSRPEVIDGISVGDLAQYLLVSRQNLSGVINRMERDGHIQCTPDKLDRRSRLVTMTASGIEVWNNQALPRIYNYYEQALTDLSISDMTHMLHYLLKLGDNMKQLDIEPNDTMEEEAI